MKAFSLTIFLSIIISSAYSKGLDTSSITLKCPPRIIRACCAFGYDIGITGIPFVKYSDVADPTNIGDHEYLGGRNEGNGIVYTYRGGFVDLAHLRDQADWTAYLFSRMSAHTGNDTLRIKLGYEGGVKELSVYLPKTISNDELIEMAGRIAYDLSVWHEISTWFVSSIPLMPERYSSFSLEDNYSNMLGIKLAIWSLKSDKPYSEAMTIALKNTLDSLKMVPSIDKTYEAMDAVYNVWWTRSYRLPSASVTQKRDLAPYQEASPFLIPGWMINEGAVCIDLASTTKENIPFTNYYNLTFKLNRKFPIDEMFPERKKHIINQNDFQQMLAWVIADVPKKVRPPKTTKDHKK
jgi:hypothetical protein